MKDISKILQSYDTTTDKLRKDCNTRIHKSTGVYYDIKRKVYDELWSDDLRINIKYTIFTVKGLFESILTLPIKVTYRPDTSEVTQDGVTNIYEKALNSVGKCMAEADEADWVVYGPSAASKLSELVQNLVTKILKKKFTAKITISSGVENLSDDIVSVTAKIDNIDLRWFRSFKMDYMGKDNSTLIKSQVNFSSVDRTKPSPAGPQDVNKSFDIIGGDRTCVEPQLLHTNLIKNSKGTYDSSYVIRKAIIDFERSKYINDCSEAIIQSLFIEPKMFRVLKVKLSNTFTAKNMDSVLEELLPTK